MRSIPLFLLAAALTLPPALSLGPMAAAEPAREDIVPNEIVVGFHDGLPADADAWVAAQGGEVLLREPALAWLSARFPDAARADAALAAAAARSDVRYAQHDGLASIQMVPNDPMYGDQWGFPAILSEQAWDITRGSHAVKVAVLDTGIQVTHPDLAANVCGPFASFVPTEATIDDGHGHGTHVSGTIAAVTNNNLGVAGMSDSCLMGAKVLSRGGGGQWSWVAAGIRWAADNGADVISMSLGGGDPGAILRDAVRYAVNDKGVLIIAAAGNSGCLTAPIVGSTIIAPAIYDEVMAVAALQGPAGLPLGLLPASFSSCGLDLEIAAPGQGILSTWRGSGYRSISGTSMATPHVSGVAALVKAQNPAIDHVELRCLLDLTADDLMEPGRDTHTGWGKVSPVKALLLDQQLTATGAHGAFRDACVAGAQVIMH